MSDIVITGFSPFSPITYLRGNPSQRVAEALGRRIGRAARVTILEAKPSCLPIVTELVSRPSTRAMLMFGAQVQLTPLVLELEGATKSDGMFDHKRTIPSPDATALSAFAGSMGVPSARAPMSPLVYWCLRSYGAALAIANTRGIPCVFMHVNALGFSDAHAVEIAYHVVSRLETLQRHKPRAEG